MYTEERRYADIVEVFEKVESGHFYDILTMFLYVTTSNWGIFISS